MKIVSERDVLTLKVGDFVEVQNDEMIFQYIICENGALDVNMMVIHYLECSPDDISTLISQDCDVLIHVSADKVELHLKK